MRFHETALRGAFFVELEPRADDRGFFARAYCEREMAEHGISEHVRQVNLSMSEQAGTVRGVHFQYPPVGETKFVRCIRGAVADVMVDLRPESPTFLRHVVIELTPENHLAAVVPERFGHAMQALVDHSEILYSVTAFYEPAEEGGLCIDDPDLGIELPVPITARSDKDRSWPPLVDQLAALRERMRA